MWLSLLNNAARVLAPRAVVTNYHKLSGLKPHKLYSLTVPEKRSLKSACHPHWFLLEAVNREPGISSSCWWCLATLGVAWLVDAPPQSLPPSSHGVHPCEPVVSLCFLSIRTPVILGWGPMVLQCDLILTNSSCKDPISKHSHILRFWKGHSSERQGGDTFQPSIFIKTVKGHAPTFESYFQV